ncbi:2OG-Fe(II) oxygenase [Alloyangia pacifica]|uniref:PKHD-type hydroxylase n=1 Tax=Alloyangia pacifica TaxID=311180 RepID=A0A1I6VBM0_9RHOB|nr:2OG-Fe(II) oxygenase [Alloyangia pacifica]SDH85146.1 PKHD-type hydroxylase [Alloyangia pacifica]SFT11025.1 PKHD-type hydroxylase [Alloyangia pacifica]
MITVHSIPQAFSETDCTRLIEIARNAEASDARLVGQQRAHNLRRADLVWLDDVEDTGWVMDRIIELVRDANRSAYDFALDAFDESAQVARYGAEREGHFDWHSDIGEGRLASRRKLTMVVQLSDEDAYEGGALELMPSNHIVTARKERGTATLFPSYMLHRVTPVTDGERHSLTIWAHGPAFR